MGNDKFKVEEVENYKKYKEQLQNEYLETFVKIELYINGSTKLNEKRKNDCFLQILDTFLSAQEEANSVKSITGRDLRKYCDSMIYGEAIYLHKATKIFDAFLQGLYWVVFFHFWFLLWYAIKLKDSSIIFQPMNLGLDEIFIIFFNIYFIPKILFIVTKNYFEDPIKCKRIKRYTTLVLWILSGGIYAFIKDEFTKYGILVSFSKLILILVYLLIIGISVLALKDIFMNESRRDELESKYFWILKRDYEKHKVKCGKHNKDSLDWDKFLKKKVKYNYIFIILWLIYGILFLVFTILISVGMFVKGNIDVVGILMLLFVMFIVLVMISCVKEGINRNKQLTKMS
ncbi:DUF1048 domain-containing protein [Clostridium grantii]|uniref:Uncharacterized protein n=1 Tax=Clostridium grantii DSM 8605 TaxID=1121316 RepID=A0A1M5UUK2_9CLOT|nr:DUF1048 domain-containing protein [Clostridium grantii]SHH66433.1 Protein of unknown function [Clostridium grantii DSM 8605]